MRNASAFRAPDGRAPALRAPDGRVALPRAPRAPAPDGRAAECRAAGYTLRERLPIYPAYVDRPGFLAPALRARVTTLHAAPDAAEVHA